MLNVKEFSGEKLVKKIPTIVLVSCTLILFWVTGWIQFSCYPMVTGGVLPKFCNSQETKLKIIKDRRSHGNEK